MSYNGEVGRYKSSHGYEKGPQLFDLVSDPHEKNNLAGKHPDVVKELSTEIQNWYPLKTAKVFE